MIRNAGNGIKALARTVLRISFIILICISVYMFLRISRVYALVVLGTSMPSVLFVSMLMYGFGELVEKSHKRVKCLQRLLEIEQLKQVEVYDGARRIDYCHENGITKVSEKND